MTISILELREALDARNRLTGDERGVASARLVSLAVAALPTLLAERARMGTRIETLEGALRPFADAGEYLDLETDGFLGGEALAVWHEDFRLFDELKFGDFSAAFAALSQQERSK